ncbi:hypothetical protein NDU88_005101 [Pleurodeles waltl]|uniref:Uncharacterized protein n=1 Tax=Pleurodeles waltl TaxID=8319 RepID=A0AAV7V6Y0_PLEWA|nr:hypothetical protein NDU88_005101 [Pleurodeles waltl]
MFPVIRKSHGFAYGIGVGTVLGVGTSQSIGPGACAHADARGPTGSHVCFDTGAYVGAGISIGADGDTVPGVRNSQSVWVGTGPGVGSCVVACIGAGTGDDIVLSVCVDTSPNVGGAADVGADVGAGACDGRGTILGAGTVPWVDTSGGIDVGTDLATGVGVCRSPSVADVAGVVLV